MQRGFWDYYYFLESRLFSPTYTVSGTRVTQAEVTFSLFFCNYIRIANPSRGDEVTRVGGLSRLGSLSLPWEKTQIL